jgi:hypothetical protein
LLVIIPGCAIEHADEIGEIVMLGSIINKALSYQSYSYIIASNHTGGAVEHADEIREIIKHRQVVLDHDDVVVLRSKVSGFGVRV